MEVCQHQQKKDTHLKDGLHGSSGGTQITSTTKYTTAGNQTIYAQWEIIKYTITYNVNGGTGSIASQTKTYGETLILSSTKPTNKYSAFLGWATSSTATSATYQPGGSYTGNGNVTLYAVWQKYTAATIYNNGTLNSGYNIDKGQSNADITNSSGYLTMNPWNNKTVYFQTKYQNRYKYLKIIAKTTRETEWGATYNLARFFISNTNSSSNSGMPVGILKNTFIVNGGTNSVTTWTTYTLDLTSITNDSYYVGMHNIDCWFYIQKIWLTND